MTRERLFHCGFLVGGVVDGIVFFEADVFCVTAEDAGAEGVEGGYGHAVTGVCFG